MKIIWNCVIICLSVFASGCIPSSSLSNGEIDRWWVLSENPVDSAQPTTIEIEKKLIPTRWTIHQESDEQVATESIERAIEQLKAGVETIEFSFSPADASRLSAVLANGRETISSLKELTEAGRSDDQEKWSQELARILAKIEYIIRLGEEGASTTLAEKSPTEDSTAHQGDATSQPLMAMLSVYLNEHTGGELLKDLSGEDIRQLRNVLVQVTLRLGFDIAGRELPKDMRESVVALMGQADDLGELEIALDSVVLEQLEGASPASQERPFRKAWDGLLSAGPIALRAMEAFLSQWDKMESIQLELLRHEGEPALISSVNVLEGQTVELADVVSHDPTMIFKGKNQIILIPKEPVTGQSLVLFESAMGGSVEFQFKGIVYGLIRLFAFPLQDCRLREIRVYSKPSQTAEKLVHVAVLMQASDDQEDPRRMLVFQEWKEETIQRDAYETSTLTKQEQHIFHYVTPHRRYTYQRNK